MTVQEAYHYGVYFLSCNGVDEAEFQSLCLVCHLAGIKNSEYRSHLDDEIIMKRFADMLWRVKNNEPLQYVIGKWGFYESEFSVGEGVLIPRPETEELTELVIRRGKALERPVIFDLCAGCGCIGLSIAGALPEAEVYLLEKSPQAFCYLQKNSGNYQNAKIFHADIFNPPNLPAADIIVSNPPYIQTGELSSLPLQVCREPVMALDGGEDGLIFYRCINDMWPDFLKEAGMLFLEIGEDQGADVSRLLTRFSEIQIIKDLYGKDRMVSAKKC